MLTKRKRRRISALLEKLFARAKEMLVGKEDRQIQVRNVTTIPDLYAAAALDGGAHPNEHVVGTIRSVTESYLDAHRHSAEARVLQAVDAALRDAESKGEPENLDEVVGTQLAEVWGKISAGVERVVDTQAQQGRALGTMEAIAELASQDGVDDPVVFFVVVRDGHRCKTCTVLHLLPDGITPRCWRMSEVGAGYYNGDMKPRMADVHPHGRCTPAYLARGYGFDKAGMVTFVSPDHDELAEQRAKYPPP